MHYVYELRDENGVPFYVGKGSTTRIKQHEQKARRGVHSPVCCKIRSVWNRGQQIRRAVVFTTTDPAEAFAEEMRLIAYYGRCNLKNQTNGGEGPTNPTQETRAKLARGRIGYKASAETRARLRLAHLGKTHTPETRAKIASTTTGRPKPWARARALANLAMIQEHGLRPTTWTDAQRQKFKAKRMGHAVSEETRRKISETKRARFVASMATP